MTDRELLAALDESGTFIHTGIGTATSGIQFINLYNVNANAFIGRDIFDRLRRLGFLHFKRKVPGQMSGHEWTISERGKQELARRRKRDTR